MSRPACLAYNWQLTNCEITGYSSGEITGSSVRVCVQELRKGNMVDIEIISEESMHVDRWIKWNASFSAFIIYNMYIIYIL